MIVCPFCKEGFSIEDDSVKPIYDSEGHILRWEHKDCEKDAEENSSRQHKTR